MTFAAPTLSKPEAVAGLADAVAADLLALERHIDEAMIRACAIGQTLAAGRMHANLAAGVGHALFEDLARVLPSLTTTRGQVVVMHNRMARQAERMGVQPTLGIEDKTDDGTVEDPFPKPKGALERMG